MWCSNVLNRALSRKSESPSLLCLLLEKDGAPWWRQRRGERTIYMEPWQEQSLSTCSKTQCTVLKSVKKGEGISPKWAKSRPQGIRDREMKAAQRGGNEGWVGVNWRTACYWQDPNQARRPKYRANMAHTLRRERRGCWGWLHLQTAVSNQIINLLGSNLSQTDAVDNPDKRYTMSVWNPGFVRCGAHLTLKILKVHWGAKGTWMMCLLRPLLLWLGGRKPFPWLGGCDDNECLPVSSWPWFTSTTMEATIRKRSAFTLRRPPGGPVRGSACWTRTQGSNLWPLDY